MKNVRRILAIIGVVVLVGMYLITLVFALMDSPMASRLLMASIACTIVIPVLLYAYQLVYRVLRRGDHDDEDKPSLNSHIRKS